MARNWRIGRLNIGYDMILKRWGYHNSRFAMGIDLGPVYVDWHKNNPLGIR